MSLNMFSSLKTCLTMESQKKRGSEEFHGNTDVGGDRNVGFYK